MKVFLSWSGKRSHAVAELLSEWLKCVLQATTPWISSRDIDRGALWFSEIGDQLRDTTIGVICLTQENKDKPWILFEAGALAKGLSSSRVCTFLIDLEPADIQDPLAQFNHTRPTRDDLWKLVSTLNNGLEEFRLEEKFLDRIFQTYWPLFDDKFKQALNENPSGGIIEPRPEGDILTEILENTRNLGARIRDLETKLQMDSRHIEAMSHDAELFYYETLGILFRYSNDMDNILIGNNVLDKSEILQRIFKMNEFIREIPFNSKYLLLSEEQRKEIRTHILWLTRSLERLSTLIAQ